MLFAFGADATKVRRAVLRILATDSEDRMWQLPDAWLLLAIGLARRPDVESVIASAVDIKGIPTCEEFRVSVGRLIAAGLVEADSNRLLDTAAGDALIRKCRVGGEGIRLVSRRIEEEMVTGVAFPQDPPSWPLSRADWFEAYERYSASMQ